MDKPKQRWAPMTADERAIVESICQPWPMELKSGTKLMGDGRRWADADDLRAWRAARTTHQSEAEHGR